MARRERTTGLPRAQRREKAARQKTLLQRTLDMEGGMFRLIVLGVCVVFAIGVVFALFASVYHQRWGHARETVVTVADEKFSLGYYADRLYQQALANPSESLGIAEQNLLRKFEEEGITLLLAKEKGIDLSSRAVNESIAVSLGVPFGVSGSAFDSALRSRLKSLGTSEGNFRKLQTAETADKKLAELLKTEIGDTGEATALRVVVLSTKDQADVILKRIQNGEDMGTVAQTESADLESRGQDGLKEPKPTALLDTAVKTAIADKTTRELIGPVQVGTQWWLIRVESRDPAFKYTDAQKSQLADRKVTETIQAKRSQVKIKRDIDSGDIGWAVKKISGRIRPSSTGGR